MPRKRKELLPEVGARLRQARNALGLSQQELADRIGKTASAMSKYEAGQISEVQVLVSLSEALDQPVERLLYGHRWRPDERTAPNTELGDPAGRRSVFQLDVPPNRVRNLPPLYRERYSQRCKEVIARAKRELEEYTRVLEAEYRVDDAKRRSKR